MAHVVPGTVLRSSSGMAATSSAVPQDLRDVPTEIALQGFLNRALNPKPPNPTPKP